MGKEKTAIGYSCTSHNCPSSKTGATGSITIVTGKGKNSKSKLPQIKQGCTKLINDTSCRNSKPQTSLKCIEQCCLRKHEILSSPRSASCQVWGTQPKQTRTLRTRTRTTFWNLGSVEVRRGHPNSKKIKSRLFTSINGSALLVW